MSFITTPLSVSKNAHITAYCGCVFAYINGRRLMRIIFLIEGSAPRLPAKWHCPVADCRFSTWRKRARPDNLLRQHHLLFQRGGRPPIPVPPPELEGRLQSTRRRNMGARHRRREVARDLGAGDGVSHAAPSPGDLAPLLGPPLLFSSFLFRLTTIFNAVVPIGAQRGAIFGNI